MRRSIGQKLKVYVAMSDLSDASGITPGDDPSIPYEGNEGEEVVVSDDGTQIEFKEKVFDVVCFYPGTPSNSAVILQFTFPKRVRFAAGLSTSQATVGTAAGTSSQEFSIQKNGSEIATCTFGVGATSGTYAMASNQTYEIGDIIKIVAPASVDAAIADISFTLDGVKKLTG